MSLKEHEILKEELRKSEISEDELREKESRFDNRKFSMICLGIIFFILFGFVTGTFYCP